MGERPSVTRINKQIAAHSSWLKTTDRKARTAPARQAFDDRFEKQVREQFPDLDDVEVVKLAKHARKIHFLRMAQRSAEVRRARAGA